MTKSNKIMLISSVVLVGFTLGVFFHYILGFYFGLKDPFNTFLFGPNSAFCDFIQVVPFTKNLAPYAHQNIWIGYFPLAYILLFPFTLIKNIFVAYLIFISGFLSFWIFMNIKNLVCEDLTKLENFRNIFILSLMSYPLLFILDRGNTDMFLFIIFALCVYAFKSEKYLLSAFLLAVDNALKPFSLLFLFLFLFKKRYKECFFSIITTGILIIGGFLLLKGDFFDQIVVLLKNLIYFKSMYVFQNNNNYGMCHFMSLFTMSKLIFCKCAYHPIISTFLLAKIYDYFFALMTIITIYFVYREKLFWKQITLLTCNMLMLPYVIGDYKLIFVMVSIWLFVNVKEKTNFDLIYTILFSLLLIPKNIIILTHLSGPTASRFFSLAIIINPLLILSIFCLIIFEQIKEEIYKKRKSS